MNKNLLACLVAASLLTGGGGAAALAAAGAPAASASTAAVSGISREHGCGPLGSLVAKGTITKTQAVAIHDAFVNYVRSHWRSTADTVLGGLVKDHTITAAQASAVITEITKWTQKDHGNESGHQSPCPHSS